eukprot:10997094-Ditylum_brightwellii.AAC.1
MQELKGGYTKPRKGKGVKDKRKVDDKESYRQRMKEHIEQCKKLEGEDSREFWNQKSRRHGIGTTHR